MIPQIDNLGFPMPFLAQPLGKAGMGREGNMPRVGAPDAVAVRDVDVMPAKLDFRHVLNKERRPSEYFHSSTPFRRPSRKGLVDSAAAVGAELHKLINDLFELAPAFIPRLAAIGGRLAHGPRSLLTDS